MGLRGFTCPPGGEEPGRQNEIDYCLGHCKKPCVMPPLLAAIWKADNQNYHQGDYISASMLAGTSCPRQTVLERSHDFYEVPVRRYWPFRGTLAHRMCEDAAGVIDKYGWLQELRLSTTLEYDHPAPIFEARILETRDGPQTVKVFTGRYEPTEALKVTVNGTVDAYNPYKRLLCDQKSQADKKAEMMVKGQKAEGSFSRNLQDEHVMQVNTYRWLLARSRIPDTVRDQLAALGLPPIKGKCFPAPTELVIQGLSMMHLPRSGGEYPWTDRGTTTLYEIDHVPVLPLHEIEEYIRPRALQWYKWLVLGESTPVVGAARAWLCKSCSFNGERVPNGICFPTQEREA